MAFLIKKGTASWLISFFVCMLMGSSTQAQTWIDSLVEGLNSNPPAFVSPDPAELANYKSQVESELRKLRTVLKQLANEFDIVERVKLDDLSEQLSSDKPNLEILDDAYFSLRFDHEELKTEDYEGLRHALYQYKNRLAIAQDPQAVETYQKTLDTLKESLIAYQESSQKEDIEGSKAALVKLRESYSWLVLANQAPQVKAEVSKHFSQPNLQLFVTQGLASELIAQKGDMSEAFNINEYDPKSGFNMVGSGSMSGKMSVSFLNNQNQGTVRVHFNGSGFSKVHGYRGIVNVYNNVFSKATGRVDLYLNGMSLVRGEPAIFPNCSVKPTGTYMNWKRPCLRKWQLGSRIAYGKALQNVPLMNTQANIRVTGEIRQKIIAKVTEAQHKLDGAMEETLMRNLRNKDLVPEMKWSSNTSTLKAKSILGDETHLGTKNKPSYNNGQGSSLKLHFHETGFENSQGTLAGETLEEEDFQETLFEKWGVRIPEEDETFGVAPCRLCFARTNVVDMDVRKDCLLSLTLRLSSYEVDEEEYADSPVEITADYRLGIREVNGKPEGIELNRMGEIKITPLAEGLDAEGLEQLGYAMDRIMMRKGWGKGLDLGMLTDGQGSGYLMPTNVTTTDDGWIIVGFSYKKAELEEAVGN